MANHIRTIFFGSSDDSVLVLEKLRSLTSPSLEIIAVVTQPARLVGREKLRTETPVQKAAQKHAVPVHTFPSSKTHQWEYEDSSSVTATLARLKPDLLITASYGQRIPVSQLQAQYGGINVHPSLLPRWRGGDPVPWAILTGDKEAGVTISTVTDAFDEGLILAQSSLPIQETSTTIPLRTELFRIGADLLSSVLPDYIEGKTTGAPQDYRGQPYARRLTRNDGYIQWETLERAMGAVRSSDNTTQSDIVSATQKQLDHLTRRRELPHMIHRAYRAFHPWPGLWTMIPMRDSLKRLKILDLHTHEDMLHLDTVQLEGKTPTSYSQFAASYLDTPAT